VFPNTTTSNVTVITNNGTSIFIANIPTYCDVLNGNVTQSKFPLHLLSTSLLICPMYLVPFSCPSGFYLANENACAFDCPSPLLTENQFDAITTMLRFGPPHLPLNENSSLFFVDIQCHGLGVLGCNRIPIDHANTRSWQATIPLR